MLTKIVNNINNLRIIDRVVDITSTHFLVSDCFLYYYFNRPLPVRLEYNNNIYDCIIESNRYITLPTGVSLNINDTVSFLLPSVIVGTLYDLNIETKDNLQFFIYKQPQAKHDILEYITLDYEFYLLAPANFAQNYIVNEYDYFSVTRILSDLFYKNCFYELTFVQFYPNFTEILQKYYNNQLIVGEYSALQMNLRIRNY